MGTTHDEHFETICTYLGSNQGTPPGIAALREEALCMLRKARPSGEMIYAALFVAEDFELVKDIHSHYGVEAFGELDAFSMNTRSMWRSSKLPQDELSQAFGWILEAWQEAFLEDPRQALQYAIETNRPEPVALICQLTSPDHETLVEVLLTKASIHRITSRNAEALLPMVCEVLGEGSAWLTVFNYAFTAERHYLRAVALAARLGVDMTSVARKLIPAHKNYEDFLIGLSSHHGRIEMMKAMPEVTTILEMQPHSLERLLKNKKALAA